MAEVDIRCLTTGNDPEITIRIADNNAATGPVVFIILGWLSDIERFLPMAASFARYGRVIIYEPRGFGRSSAPHRKDIYRAEAYNEEMAFVLKSLNVPDGDFLLCGFCTGAAMAVSYLLQGKGPKPSRLALISPQVRYRTPFWFPLFGSLPGFIMTGITNLIIFALDLYLRRKSPEETRNLRYVEEQFRRSDPWAQRQFLVQYVHRYDIEQRLAEIEVPMICFVGEQDWFARRDMAVPFLHHPLARVETLPSGGHRIQVGNEERIARKIGEFISQDS